jgi:hypothetical protein
MKTIRAVGLLTGLLAFALMSHAQQSSNPALKPLAFLSGRWVSVNGSEMQEENWSPVSGDSMIGSFRIVKSDKAVFYEFWAIELEHDRPVLKLKHFNANLAGWEEKDASTAMPLVSSSQNDVVFAEADGSVSLHYHRVGETLTCTVHHVKNGKGSDEVFSMTRAEMH